MSATNSFIEMTDDGAWCWFQDPRAVRYAGDRDRTYTGWVTADGDLDIACYDHDTEQITEVTLHADYQADDHDDPTFYVDSDGRLLVFYSLHAGPEICFRRSEEPEDLSAFTPEGQIAPSEAHTYPDPRLIDETLYLFYRNVDGSVAYVESTDEGRTWSAETELVTTDGRDWCVYRKISDVHEGAVDLGLTWAQGGGHHPHRSIRHARFDGETLRASDGSTITRGEPATFWDTTLVYDSDETGNDAWIWDCGIAGGQPELVYAELPSEDDHAYRYARWTEEGWNDVPLGDGGSHIVPGDGETYYSGGVSLDHTEPGVCYYSTGDSEGSRIVRASTTDHGETWEHTDITDASDQNVRPVIPRNRHDDLAVLWMQGSYTHYAGEYDTGIVGAPSDG